MKNNKQTNKQTNNNITKPTKSKTNKSERTTQYIHTESERNEGTNSKSHTMYVADLVRATSLAMAPIKGGRPMQN